PPQRRSPSDVHGPPDELQPPGPGTPDAPRPQKQPRNRVNRQQHTHPWAARPPWSSADTYWHTGDDSSDPPPFSAGLTALRWPACSATPDPVVQHERTGLGLALRATPARDRDDIASGAGSEDACLAFLRRHPRPHLGLEFFVAALERIDLILQVDDLLDPDEVDTLILGQLLNQSKL